MNTHLHEACDALLSASGCCSFSPSPPPPPLPSAACRMGKNKKEKKDRKEKKEKKRRRRSPSSTDSSSDEEEYKRRKAEKLVGAGGAVPMLACVPPASKFGWRARFPLLIWGLYTLSWYYRRPHSKMLPSPDWQPMTWQVCVLLVCSPPGEGAPRAPRLQAKKVAQHLKKHRVTGIDYTNEDNPFGDANLTERFVWGKKIEKELVSGRDVRDMTAKAEARRQAERLVRARNTPASCSLNPPHCCVLATAAHRAATFAADVGTGS